MEEQRCPSKHICLTQRDPMMISSDPEYVIICALADKDVLTMVRGLVKENACSPFPDGLYEMDSTGINAAIRKVEAAGLISSRRDGNDHVYFLNKCRFRAVPNPCPDGKRRNCHRIL